MAKFIIQGGHKLEGEISIGGMKNAATPILAATLLTDEECVISNLPRIADVERMLEIFKSLGSQIEWRDEHTVAIKNRDLNLASLDNKLVKSMRSSILLWGPMLARFHQVTTPEPGGCIIGARPIDAHLEALEKLGARVEKQGNDYLITAEQLVGATLYPVFSVTATENALMAAVTAKGTTEIHIAAAEPHVQDLGRFLIAMGAKIEGLGTHTIKITGVEKLGGARHHLIADAIEAMTYAVAAVITHGDLKIKNIQPEDLELVVLKLREIGVDLEVGVDYIHIKPSYHLKAFKLQTLPYPGFPTDLQAVFGILATQCEGTTLIHETLYENRFNYVNELVKMGANAIIADPHRVVVNGPTPLYGQEMKSFDLRAGATLIIAGLVAQGETIINEAEIVDRGYEKIEERLTALGADIKRTE